MGLRNSRSGSERVRLEQSSRSTHTDLNQVLDGAFGLKWPDAQGTEPNQVGICRSFINTLASGAAVTIAVAVN